MRQPHSRRRRGTIAVAAVVSVAVAVGVVLAATLGGRLTDEGGPGAGTVYDLGVVQLQGDLDTSTKVHLPPGVLDVSVGHPTKVASLVEGAPDIEAGDRRYLGVTWIRDGPWTEADAPLDITLTVDGEESDLEETSVDDVSGDLCCAPVGGIVVVIPDESSEVTLRLDYDEEVQTVDLGSGEVEHSDIVAPLYADHPDELAGSCQPVRSPWRRGVDHEHGVCFAGEQAYGGERLEISPYDPELGWVDEPGAVWVRVPVEIRLDATNEIDGHDTDYWIASLHAELDGRRPVETRDVDRGARDHTRSAVFVFRSTTAPQRLRIVPGIRYALWVDRRDPDRTDSVGRPFSLQFR